jgi:hypothetical protein
MGLDVHSTNYLLRLKKKFGDFGKTITIGRQGVHLTSYQKNKIFRTDSSSAHEKWKSDNYCEQLLLQHFGATSVVSIDASSYENASIIHDMNTPLIHGEKYKTVLDIGTCEHVFDALQFMHNLSGLVADDGLVVHVSPANNYCNHGFYQFSPCFWLDYYSNAGFQVEEMLFASPANNRTWYEVDLQNISKFTGIRTRSEYLILVTARKRSGVPINSRPPNQGYYETNRWLENENNRAAPMVLNPLKENMKYFLANLGVLKFGRFVASLSKDALGKSELPAVKKVRVKSLI